MIIAEIGHNHNGSMELAKELIHKAKECGADIAKFQLYDVSRILQPDHPAYWDLDRSQLTKEQWLEIASECSKVGIECLASAFDTERVGWCEEAGVMRYKVASRSIYDTELLEKLVTIGKDMIISLGKVDDRGIPKINAPIKVDYLYCIANYPTKLNELKLESVDFAKYSGFSDHTIGVEASMAAIARGAIIVEKHFTLDKNMDGFDHACSAEPDELKRLVEFTKMYEEMR